jgi:hypothetical protein
MNAGLGGANGKVPMQRIGQRNVNGVNRPGFKIGVKLLVHADRGNVVTAAKFSLFHSVIRE